MQSVSGAMESSTALKIVDVIFLIPSLPAAFFALPRGAHEVMRIDPSDRRLRPAQPPQMEGRLNTNRPLVFEAPSLGYSLGYAGGSGFSEPQRKTEIVSAYQLLHLPLKSTWGVPA